MLVGNKPDVLIVLGSDHDQFVSNDLINFPMCTECKEGQKPIKKPKT